VVATLTYQQRNALAAKPFGALQPVTGLPTKPQPSSFAALEATTMGVLGTPKDGFDATLAPLIAAVPGHATQIAAMDKNLSAATFTPGLIVKTIYGPIGDNIAALAKIGDAQLADIGATVGVTTGTPPPPGGGSPCHQKETITYEPGPFHGGGGGRGAPSCPESVAKLATIRAAVPLTAVASRPPTSVARKG
jgi:hypothetical protein